MSRLAAPVPATFDPADVRPPGARDAWRTFATAARLGWLIESNWTDPLLFGIYSVARPVASALILVVMLEVIAGGAAGAMRSFVVVGSALWSFVMSGIAGLGWSVLDDRERYRMLKYVYVSPGAFVVTLLGRGVARVAIGGMGALITLVVGVVFLGVPFDPARIDWPLLGLSMVLGLGAILAIGVGMAAIVLQTRQESWHYPEAVAGALLLVSTAVFPLGVLPLPLQAIGLAVPLTWWLAGVRQALFPASTVPTVGGEGSAWQAITGSLAPDTATIALLLLATTVLVTLGAAAAFRVSERRAKDRGLIDQLTGS
ncbi:MAG TPA: ABC transporter permease [Candidatus Limnocylindrales bacterium]|nr:ABC transporter permease [Candidatus Limnocylindrales bacterium]